MLTASHNPKEYNGYKAYGADGGQLVAPHDQAVMDEVAKISSIEHIKFDGKPENIRSKRLFDIFFSVFFLFFFLFLFFLFIL